MATLRSSLPHEERTAGEPRDERLQPVVLSHVREINSRIRLLRLHAADPSAAIRFLPGQWLDTFVPGVPRAGGFTITSTPRESTPHGGTSPPYLELAVQKSGNPPAQWLWRPSDEILGARLTVRVGGSFTWPPPASSGLDEAEIERVVLVAGGVGINPLISIFTHLVHSPARPREVHFLYATKVDADRDPRQILFLPRLTELAATAADRGVTVSLFLTGPGGNGDGDGQLSTEVEGFPIRTFPRRITQRDVVSALDGFVEGEGAVAEIGRAKTVCYVCGPQRMTDEVVDYVQRQSGMSKERTLSEKWW